MPSNDEGQVHSEHLLFEAIEPPRVGHDVEEAIAAIRGISWSPQFNLAAKSTGCEEGAEGWIVYLSYEFAAALWPGKQVALREVAPLCVVQRVRLAGRGMEVFDAREKATRFALVPNDRWIEPDPLDFLSGVEKIHQWLRSGDVYQVNLTRRWQAQTDQEGVDLYARLLARNPAPFAARACFPGVELISSSPERLFEVRRGEIQTQPIAGTRPRSTNPEADAALRTALKASPKETAEHIMLVDLERNDLGRICEVGSVHVPRLLDIEPYASVQHIVSDVRGRLRPEISMLDVLRSVFPGGTITGCPKVHCMELITRLEHTPRSAYTGSLGYCLDDGSADFNILIRTLEKRGRELMLGAGAGIVAASDPQDELTETRHKAAGVINALAGTSARPFD